MLTEQEVELFRTNGYLLPGRQLLSEERLTELEAIFNDHLAHKGDKLSDELDTPHYRDERLLSFLLSDEVLDWVEPLVGPDIAAQVRYAATHEWGRTADDILRRRTTCFVRGLENDVTRIRVERLLTGQLVA